MSIVNYWRIYKIERKKQSSAQYFVGKNLFFFQKLFLIKLRQGNWISRRYKNSRHRYLFDNKWFFPTRRISRVLRQQYDSCWAIFVTFQRQYLHVSRTLFIIKSRVIHYDHKSTHILASVIFRSGEYPREQSASAARNRPRMDPASDASYCGLGLFVEGEERIVAKREPKQTPGRDSPASGAKIILFPRRSRPLAHSHEMRCTVHRYIGHRPSRRLNRGWQMGGLIETSSQHRGRHMAALAGNQNSDMKRITWRLDLSWREDRASLSLSLFLSLSDTFRAQSKVLVKEIARMSRVRRNGLRDPFKSILNGFLRI